jgi:hypothetical protein
MEPADKPAKPAAKGRKRQPKKSAIKEEPAEASNQIEETAPSVADEEPVPQPTLSQRLTKSLKQLSQLGKPKKEEVGGQLALSA